MSEKGLQVLEKKNSIPFAKGTLLDPCDYCLLGKKNRVSFSRKSTKKSEILELLYYDVCGPIEVESLGGYKYFVTFIDDASRKTWVYLLNQKTMYSRTFDSFMLWWKEKPGSPLSAFIQITEVNTFPMNSENIAPNMGFNMRRRSQAPRNTMV